MRSLILLLLVCCSSGCATHTLTSHAPVTPEQIAPVKQPKHFQHTRKDEKHLLKILGVSHFTPCPGPATLDQIETAKQRIHLLHGGMTEKQVFNALGLSNCYGRCYNVSVGGWSEYALAVHHGLWIRYGSVGLSKWFVSDVSIDDVNWRRNEKM